jgi:hypothetical protein
MSRRTTRTLIGGAAALGIGLFAALPSALPVSAASGVPTVRLSHPHVLYDLGVHSGVTRAEVLRAAAAAPTFTQYKASVKVGTKSYTYIIAGKNPAKKMASPASVITTELVPLIVKFSNGDSWDPARKDSCDSGASALTRAQNSPVFKSQSWTWGGTKIGTGQITDAYQRADFWKYAKPAGINPKFGINLKMTTLSPVTIHVPNADAAAAITGCGNSRLGLVNVAWLDSLLRKTVIPSLFSRGVNPGTVPFFLLHNVVEYIGSPTTACCVGGYHQAYINSHGAQTYGLADYDNSGALGSGLRDITALSHEVGEWQNDPYIDKGRNSNPTPAWGHIGQASGCQSDLEVGDPLAGTTFADTVGGFTYHPQELAFFSWFYHQKPSLGVNGWYSDQGKFTTSAASCT